MPETPEVADFEVPVSTIPVFVRVKDKGGDGRSYSVVESAVDPDTHQVLKQPAAYPDGQPLEPTFPELSTTRGPKAEPKKETS